MVVAVVLAGDSVKRLVAVAVAVVRDDWSRFNDCSMLSVCLKIAL